MPSRTLLLAAALSALSGCASSAPDHIPGAVPRDTNGRPIWSMIEPTAPVADRPTR